MNTPAIKTVDLKEFPTTRYRGSKRKILPWIYNNLSGLEYESVSDLFGGTGSVSYLFKRMGKKVIYNDHL
jgi:adenine-specific DNA-methyltransferase